VRAWLAEFILSYFLLLLSTPVEIGVPVIRRLQRKRGVQVGPAIGSLLAYGGGRAYFKATLHQPAGTSKSKRWIDRGVTSANVVLPALGAVVPGTVVLRTRSPLWGWVLWIGVRITAATVLAEEADRVKKKRMAAFSAGEND